MATKTYQITCTEKQLQIIANACELYGDVQNGNPLSIADHLPLVQKIDRFAMRQSLTALFKQHKMQACSDDANDAIAIWRKITRNNDFTHGTEPTITIKELENTDVNKDDLIEQDMLEKDICFICHEQNDICECNDPETYAQPRNIDIPKWVKITCVDDMPIDEGFVLLKHTNGDILVGQYTFDESPFTATTEFYQSQDYEWLADLDDIVSWCKIPAEDKNDADNKTK